MEKLNFDIEKYQSLTPAEKVEALSKIFFKYLDEGLIVENAPEELIENIYNETINKITNLFRREQGEIDYEITSYEDEGFLYYSKIRNNYISEIDYRNLKNLPNSFRFKFQFRKNVYGENKGTIDTQTIGYEVFSNFRNRVQSKKKVLKTKLSNAKKLALLHTLGIFDLPKMKTLSNDKQNEIIGLLLDADKTEFVYKNRLNINSKDPNYQIEKYTSYQYLTEMENLLNETD